MYVSRGPLPVGVGLPAEARLQQPAGSAARQTNRFRGIVGGRGGSRMGAVLCCHRLSVTYCLGWSQSQFERRYKPDEN